MPDRSDNRGSAINQPFRPRARVLQLLGDELIGSPRLAVFELVKNAYDADATNAAVTLDLRSENAPAIMVEDDGEGMTLDLLQNVWLVPGHDHRRRQRERQERSAVHGRLPLGEKGLGRFAVHKLGNRIRLTTRAQDSEECVVEIDWNELIERPFLDEAPVTIRVREPEVFMEDRTGTRIEVSELRPPEWTRGEVRRLCNQITSICSPFQEQGDFQATLVVPGNEHWIEDLPDFAAIIDRAIWRFSFWLEDGQFDWSYEFRQIAGLSLDSRTVAKEGDRLLLPAAPGSRQRDQVIADATTTRGIGPILGELYVYDRDGPVLQRLGATRLFTTYLDEYGGIRVYRDGIRVYNYGEQGDDWLGLDLRRVNAPTRGISRNIVLGAVHLSLDESTSLREKTNREGFVENEALERLQQIVLGALGALEGERQLDKQRIRRVTERPSDPVTDRLEAPIAELRNELERHDLRERLEPYVARIQRQVRDMQETLLTAGMSGLNLAVVFHEVERGVRGLHQAIVEGRDLDEAAAQAQELMRILDGFATLLRRDSKREHSAQRLVLRARQINLLRLRHHRIQLECPLLDGNGDFEARYSFGLVLGALNNLIDNALYWMRVRWPDQDEEPPTQSRRLFIGATDEFADGPAIVIADNGVGFQGDSAEDVTRPFFTRKPDGMGLGLYYANLAMELNDGRLAFPQREEVEIPDAHDGAITSLVFGRRT
ncbi:MAG: ATP-binding protein [Gammaproteobacteria bacterium]|nr:ATP-binding protein [Gammaproteobacteria bacterium]